MIEFGFMMGLSPREPIARFGELARQAEDLGFEMAWLGDSQLFTKDVYVGLTLAALATNRIRLGPGVTNPVTRHFSVLANTMAALNEVSSGRAQLGLGSGDASVLPLGIRPARVDALREAVLGIRQIAAGGGVQVGERRLAVPTGGRPFPILISASQPRMLSLAGEVADGVILMGAADRELTRWQLDWVAAGATRSGRHLEDIYIDLWFAISISEDREHALDDVRPWATSQARWFYRWKELPEPLRPFREDFERAHRTHDFERHLSRHADDPAGRLSDEFVGWVGVAGSLEECAGRIRRLLDLKVDRITFSLLPGGRTERLRQYGKELIPRLRGGVST